MEIHFLEECLNKFTVTFRILSRIFQNLGTAIVNNQETQKQSEKGAKFNWF